MNNSKLIAGQEAPKISLPRFGGGELDLFKAPNDGEWRMVVVYRGKHCPICAKYLAKLKELYPQFKELGVSVAAVSADPIKKVDKQIGELKPDYEVGYDLSVEQMRTLGLYISNPRSEKETDRVFPEPALFVVNADHQLQIIDLSNAPFARPDLESILNGIKFIRENNYPIRGTH